MATIEPSRTDLFLRLLFSWLLALSGLGWVLANTDREAEEDPWLYVASRALAWLAFDLATVAVVGRLVFAKGGPFGGKCTAADGAAAEVVAAAVLLVAVWVVAYAWIDESRHVGLELGYARPLADASFSALLLTGAALKLRGAQ